MTDDSPRKCDRLLYAAVLASDGGRHRQGKGVLSLEYEAPRLIEVGSVRALTLGEGWKGNDDTLLWFFRYGTDPSS